jgi:predicted protein tyrosine phosphatase
MTHVQAIQKLIARNIGLVNKSGPTDYTRETDAIINVLLAYIHTNESQLLQAETIEQNRELCFMLFDIPDEFKTMDNDFIERYIKYQVIPELHFSCGGTADNFELNALKIIRHYNFAVKQIEAELEQFNIMKPLLMENFILYKDINPTFSNWIKYNYTESEIFEVLKRKVYYNNE